ncbi:unnamed protein product [Calicophoron daubneyi]|uniref:Rho-GAP domain-containing protein n=1 Tax=Calicophoron daubneyi TaxID=300641 RepID=A0AAV2TKF7_CALDB
METNGTEGCDFTDDDHPSAKFDNVAAYQQIKDHLLPECSPNSAKITDSIESHVSSRRSSSQKIAKLINALTPCHGRAARRSHSIAAVIKCTRETDSDWEFSQKFPTKRFNASFDLDMDTVTSPGLSAQTVNLAQPTCAFTAYTNQLDASVAEPTPELHEFRIRYPTSFVALVANYLGFIEFTSADNEGIRDALVKEAKKAATVKLQTANEKNETESIAKYRLLRSRQTRHVDKELEHWYVVSNSTINYLLRDNRYKCRFILRRPGSQSAVNELERDLFPARGRPLSANVKNRQTDHLEEQLFQHAKSDEIYNALARHDPFVVASLLARVLRRHGIGLIPAYLRGLFLQLVSGVRENEMYQRRGVRLLFQLLNRQLSRSVIQPLFELMARIADEPECELDERSLAVLFSPVFFTDRSSANPAALANPMFARLMQMFVGLARDELSAKGTTTGLFHVPELFLEDCHQNLRTHLALENPPLYCSLKYCVTMIPSPRSQSKKFSTAKDSKDVQIIKSIIPNINLTATFLAKRPRHAAPACSTESPTPGLKIACQTPPHYLGVNSYRPDLPWHGVPKIYSHLPKSGFDKNWILHLSPLPPSIRAGGTQKFKIHNPFNLILSVFKTKSAEPASE